jgi:hypothetical protein
VVGWGDSRGRMIWGSLRVGVGAGWQLETCFFVLCGVVILAELDCCIYCREGEGGKKRIAELGM